MGPCVTINYDVGGKTVKIKFEEDEEANHYAVFQLFNQVGKFALMKAIWEDPNNENLFNVMKEHKEKYPDDYPNEMSDVENFFEDYMEEDDLERTINCWCLDFKDREIKGSLTLKPGRD